MTIWLLCRGGTSLVWFYHILWRNLALSGTYERWIDSGGWKVDSTPLEHQADRVKSSSGVPQLGLFWQACLSTLSLTDCTIQSCLCAEKSARQFAGSPTFDTTGLPRWDGRILNHSGSAPRVFFFWTSVTPSASPDVFIRALLPLRRKGCDFYFVLSCIVWLPQFAQLLQMPPPSLHLREFEPAKTK